MKLALEITRQVASGLAAVHKKSLVHRDIKPSNIMVSFEEEGAVTAKIIDLGLAKIADESGAQTTISASGAFAGTPEFASPGANYRRRGGYPFGSLLAGSFALANADRSGAIWRFSRRWSWLSISTLRCRLRSSQASRSRWSTSSKCFLVKIPARRFQTPAELLKALPAIMDAIEKGSTIAYTSLGTASRSAWLLCNPADNKVGRRRFR